MIWVDWFTYLSWALYSTETKCNVQREGRGYARYGRTSLLIRCLGVIPIVEPGAQIYYDAWQSTQARGPLDTKLDLVLELKEMPRMVGTSAVSPSASEGRAWMRESLVLRL